MRKLTDGKQLLLTLWKFGIQFRCNWKKYVVETLVKVILIYILSFIISEGVTIEIDEQFISVENLFIMYFPSNGETDALMANYVGHPRTPGATVQPFASESLLLKEWDSRVDRELDNYNTMAIIFFEASDNTLNYSIKSANHPSLKHHHVETFFTDDTLFQQFFKRGLALQMVIESAFIRKVTGISVVEKDPKPLLHNIEYSTAHKALLLLKFTSWTGLFICTTLFRAIMEEKERGLKLYQNILGINSYMLWIGRMMDMVVKSMVSNAAVAFAMAYVIRFPWWLLWLYLSLFAMKAASFLFFMSVWFTNSINALIFVAVLWTSVGNIGKFLIIYWYDFDAKVTRLAFAFVFPNIGLALGFYNIAKLETFDVQNVASDERKREELQFLSIVGLMLAATVFFLLLTFYLDPIWEPEIGAMWKPWPLKRRYRGASRTPQHSVVDVDYVLPLPEPGFQNPPIPANPAVRIRGISKNFKDGVLLDNISMDFFTNEVTILLGENGCGKSTLVGLITGKCIPSHGTVYVQSLNIREENDLNLIRPNIGWCPQNNIFLPCMTVKQLLTYAGKLRGMDRIDNEEQVNYLLDSLSIRMVANRKPISTVHSIKRLISFAFAVMGRPPILLLDEPAEGIDVESRRLMWNVIKDMRRHRVIVIITNHMDMVDEIADRAVVLKNAKIRCWGSPKFLKDALGVNGFRLFVEPGANVSVKTIKRAVLHYFPEAKRVSGQLHPLQFVLPRTHFSRLDRLLNALRRLRVLRHSCSPCTMEAVFMHVTRSKKNKTSEETPVPSITSEFLYTGQSLERTKDSTYWEQFRSLCKKEIILIKRSWYLYLSSIIMQIFIIGSIIMVSEWRMIPKTSGITPFSLESYRGNVLYQSAASTPMESSYMELAKEHQSRVQRVDDVMDTVARSVKRDRLSFVYEHYIGAILIEKEREGGAREMGTPLYNPVGTFTSMVSVNLFNNAILRALGYRQATIIFNIHPFKEDKFLTVRSLLIEGLWGELMVIVMFLWMTAYGFPVYEENKTGSFRMQSLAGASSIMYWLSRYVCHVTLHALLTCILLITTITGGTNMFSCPSSAGALVVIWLVFGLTGIPFIYLLNRIFSEVIDVVIAIIAVVVTKQRECMIPRYYLRDVADYILALLGTCVLYLVFLMWWDKKSMWLWRLKKEMVRNYVNVRTLRRKDTSDAILADTDILKERIHAQVAYFQMTRMPKDYQFVLPPENILVANDVTLKFRGTMVAGRGGGVSLRVPPASCLGLMGGDRTDRELLLYLLSGLLLPTQGDVAGIACALCENRRRFMANIGFISSHDGVLSQLKVQEQIDLICRLKGVRTEEFLQKWMYVLGLDPLLPRLVGSLSHGRQRLLSIALAMIGEPSALLMDTPTTDMDPRTRRRVGNALAMYMRTSRAIVFTTNNLADVLALSSHVGCAYLGQILCRGTFMYLRERYRKGYFVFFEMKNIEEDLNTIRKLMREEFKGKSKCIHIDRDKVHFVILGEKMTDQELLKHLENVRNTVPGVMSYIVRDRSIIHMLTTGLTQPRI